MFEIKQGLFQFDVTDNHAILGVSMEADFEDIRKRYMRVARRLHPDTCPFQNPADQELAKQLLAKLVSPAYNQFSKENERKEYVLLLKTMGDRAVKEQRTIQWQTEAAQQLIKAHEYQKSYESALENLSKQQFESPQKVIEVIGQISELNLAYLLRKTQRGGVGLPSSVVQETPAPTPPPPKKDSFVEQACRRAEQLVGSQNYAGAILELKDALKREPDNSQCHGLLGLVYLKQNQPKLATPHVNRALQLNPKQPEALEAKKQLEKATSQATPKAKASKPAANKSENSGGGLFGGLFGGKKK